MTTQAAHLAARMARWSAHHRKMAIFGWLALVIALFAVSIVSPAKTDRLRDVRARRVGPRRHDPVRGLQAAVRGERADPARDAQGERARVQGRRRIRHHRAWQASRRSRRSSRRSTPTTPARSPPDKRSVLVPMEIRGPSEDAADKVDPIVARVKDLQQAQSGVHHRVVRREHRQGGHRTAFFDDLKKAGLYSVPLTLDHPAGRLRRARGRRHPAPARADRRARDLRAGRADQPAPADVRRGRRAHPADRARRGRRLHDVLFEAGTRRARRGPDRGGSARGCGGHVRSIGADLRSHRPRRHVRDAAHLRRRVRLLRSRHDDRGRGRDARAR